MKIMPEPNDLQTHEDLHPIFRITSHFVEPENRKILALPERTWLDKTGDDFRFLLYAPTSQRKQNREYVQALTNLMQAHVDSFDPASESCSIQDFIEKENGQPYDLLIVGDEKHSFPKPIRIGLVSRSLFAWWPSSLFILREPKWPLKHILLILQHNEWDGKAVDWLIHLSKRCEAVATVATIVPPTPAMYQNVGRFAGGLTELLASDCALGQHIRRISKRLVAEGIEANCRLLQGSPEVQIQQELVRGNYDLCIIGAEPRNRLKRFFLGEMVAPLLKWIRKPVLVAQGM